MNSSVSSKDTLDKLKEKVIDPLAIDLIESLKWSFIKGISQKENELYPIAVLGKGIPLLMIHGFDSCFLEFRRLAPLLKNNFKLIIPDLYGFGFCPRSQKYKYEYQKLISHLIEIINLYCNNLPLGVIGASMGGSVAMELARRNPKTIYRLLLLSPAGISSTTRKIPRPLDLLGTYFLKQPCIRKSLCRQAFADPNKSVGKAEEQIASLHLNVPGWQRSLAEFARSGGISDYGKPLPSQPIDVIWGAQDKIIKRSERTKSMILIGKKLSELENCGHLPHLDNPNFVAKYWQNINEEKLQSN